MRPLALILAFATGCGPQLQTLASQHHYREAVCAAADGSGDDRDFVRRALVGDLNPQLHVEVVRPDQLDRALAGRGDLDRITGRVRFVRVRLETNVLPVDDLDADITFTSNGVVVAAPIEWSTLAAITEEKLPPQETYSTYAHSGTAWRGLAAFFTLGMSLPFTTFRKRSYSADAPLPVYERTAPAAFRLRAAMLDGHGCRHSLARTSGNGLTCTWYAALDPATAGPIQLDLTLAYSAQRVRHRDSWRTQDGCRVTHPIAIQLGEIRTLEARTTRTFGPRMRPLRELTLDR